MEQLVMGMRHRCMRSESIVTHFSIQKMWPGSRIILSLVPQVWFHPVCTAFCTSGQQVVSTNYVACISNLVQSAIFNWLRGKFHQFIFKLSF